MSKILMIIAPENYRDEELTIPQELLLQAGHSVVVASRGVTSAKGMMGGSAEVHVDLERVDPDEYDAVVLVGGGGASIYFHDSKVQEILKSAVAAGKVIAAICISPSILANAGLLTGKKATSSPSEKDNLVKNGALFTDGGVVVDGKLVTADGPQSASKFGEELLRLLS